MRDETLGWLLSVVNARPPMAHRWGYPTDRDVFYGIKDRVLRARGRPTGSQWQEISHECWGCDGTGRRKDQNGVADPCPRCGGTGAFDRFYVQLRCYDLGGFSFHSPMGVRHTYIPIEASVDIVGKIVHGRPDPVEWWVAWTVIRLRYEFRHTVRCWWLGVRGAWDRTRTRLRIRRNMRRYHRRRQMAGDTLPF